MDFVQGVLLKLLVNFDLCFELKQVQKIAGREGCFRCDADRFQ